MGTRENECQISQNYILHMKFSEFYLRFHNSCEIWHSFSQTPLRNFLWCYHRRLITSLGLENCRKECNILWIILVQSFCPLRIKITQFPGGFRLKINLSKEKPSLQTPLKKRLRKVFQIVKTLVGQRLPTQFERKAAIRNRKSALLKHNNKKEKEILPLVTKYQLLVSITFKEALMKKRKSHTKPITTLPIA